MMITMRSLKTRLIVNVIAIHAVLMGAIVVDTMVREERYMYAQLNSKALVLSKLLASNVALPLLNHDLTALEELMSGLDDTKELAMLFVLSPEGRVRASTPRHYFNLTLTDATSRELLREIRYAHVPMILKVHDGYLDAIHEIMIGGQKIGYVRLMLDTALVQEDLRHSLYSGLLYILIAIMLGALFAYYTVDRVTAGLGHLAEAARAIAKRQFETKLPEIKTHDELADVIEAFGVMKQTLSEYLDAIALREERLALALEGSSDGLWDWDMRSHKVYYSARYLSMLGYTQEEFGDMLQAWNDHLHPEDRMRAMLFINRFLQSSEERFELHFRMRRADGHYLPILVRGKKILDADGVTMRMVGTHVDMSEIDSMRRYLQSIIDGVDLPIMVIDADYTVSLSNKASAALDDASLFVDPLRPKCYEVSHGLSIPCDGVDHPCPLREAMHSGTPIKVTHNHTDTQGNTKMVELTAQPIFGSNLKVESIIEVTYDITELIEAQNLLRHQAQHDLLTNLPNRLLFLDRLQQAIKSAKRNHSLLAVLFLDLDHFKEVNDTLGHDAGDILLKNVAEILHDSVRSSDTVARLGGDEFTVLLNGLTPKERIVQVIQKIMHKMEQPHLIGHKELFVTFSIGVAFYPQDGEAAEVLLKNADTAMYRAKTQGRNTYRYYSEAENACWGDER